MRRPSFICAVVNGLHVFQAMPWPCLLRTKPCCIWAVPNWSGFMPAHLRRPRCPDIGRAARGGIWRGSFFFPFETFGVAAEMAIGDEEIEKWRTTDLGKSHERQCGYYSLPPDASKSPRSFCLKEKKSPCSFFSPGYVVCICCVGQPRTHAFPGQVCTGRQGRSCAPDNR